MDLLSSVNNLSNHDSSGCYLMRNPERRLLNFKTSAVQQ